MENKIEFNIEYFSERFTDKKLLELIGELVNRHNTLEKEFHILAEDISKIRQEHKENQEKIIKSITIISKLLNSLNFDRKI